MKEQILEILKNAGKALSVHDIESELGFNSVEELKELLKALNELEDTLKVSRTKKNNYMLFDDHNLAVGVISTNPKGFGFVAVPGREDIYIDKRNLNGALHNDEVIVEYLDKDKR